MTLGKAEYVETTHVGGEVPVVVSDLVDQARFALRMRKCNILRIALEEWIDRNHEKIEAAAQKQQERYKRERFPFFGEIKESFEDDDTAINKE